MTDVEVYGVKVVFDPWQKEHAINRERVEGLSPDVEDILRNFECSICLSEVKSVKLSSCTHRVCTDCAMSMRNNGTESCPLCRTQISWVDTPIDGDDDLFNDFWIREVIAEQRVYLADHRELCAKFLTVDCPWCLEKLPMKEISAHIDVCPEREVCCNVPGCTAVYYQKDRDLHIRGGGGHHDIPSCVLVDCPHSCSKIWNDAKYYPALVHQSVDECALYIRERMNATVTAAVAAATTATTGTKKVSACCRVRIPYKKRKRETTEGIPAAAGRGDMTTGQLEEENSTTIMG